tara:strand:- start:641 stop:931 length:291 start_codon:yes stop_codon:yes gene_type:complete
LQTAIRIRTEGVQIPPASNDNLERMARAYYEQSRQLWRVLKFRELPEFDDLDDETRDIQVSGMRAAYASLAVSGGASIEPINNVNTDPDAEEDQDS